MRDWSKFKIGDLEMFLIQGPMGIGVSRHKLTGAVANSGGGGTIASVELGLGMSSGKNLINENRLALQEEIRKAREISKDGVIGVNVMRALTDYKGLVEVASREDVDYITSGAGVATDLPLLVKNPFIKLIPIVSSLKAAKTISHAWARYKKTPDAIIIEGPEAGGHLGFSFEDVINGTAPTLENILGQVLSFTNDPSNFETPVPVIVAGGIYTGQDIKRYQDLGAAGVQMATRFVTTKECDADDEFKRTYLNSKKEDIVIIKSPVGLPGRAIKNSFLKKVNEGEKIYFKCKYNCLKTCDPKSSPYCIAEALDGAQQGNFERGFAFAGSNAYRATPENCLDEKGQFITVKTLMERIGEEFSRR